MREELRDPRLIDHYVRTYNAELASSLASTAAGTRSKLQARLAAIARERERKVDLVIRAVIEDDDARQALGALKEERLAMEAELASLDNTPKIIALHPTANSSIYLRPWSASQRP